MKSPPRDYTGRDPPRCQGAVQGFEFVYKLYIGAVCKAEIGEEAALQDVIGEHFLSGAGCGGVVHAPYLRRYMLYTGERGT